MRLTQRECDQATYTGTVTGEGKDRRATRCVLWDDDPRGLGLRVFPGGTKSWVLAYRTPGGTKRLHTLGDFDVMKLARARSEARAELVRVEREQADPQAEKAARRMEATTGTVEAMVRAYIRARAADPKRPMRSAADTLALAEKTIFRKLGKRPWNELSRHEIRDWHEAFAEIPYQGNRALQCLRAAYYWRLAQEDGTAAPAGTRGRRPTDYRNPAAAIPLFPEKRRQTRLELSDLAKFEAAIDAETADPYLRAYFRFVLAVGARRSEALTLQWADVDTTPKRAAVTFRATKTEPERTVPLAPATLKLLKSLPRVEGNPYVFVGRVEGAPVVGVDKLWNRIRTRAGRPDLRIHDLRRSFGSWLGDQGFSSKQIGTVLGHKTDITSRVYMALGDASSRAAVTAAQDLMAKARKTKRAARRAEQPA